MRSNNTNSSLLACFIKTNTTQSVQWTPVHSYIKANHSYKSLHAIITTYWNKVRSLLTSDLHHPNLLLKQVDHTEMLNQLRSTYGNIIDDLNMIEMDNIALQVNYTISKLIECVEIYYRNVDMLVKRLAEENSINHTRYVYNSKCSQCQDYAHKNKIQAMMGQMTITSKIPTYHISNLQSQLDSVSSIYTAEDLHLSAQVQQILQRKQQILGNKNMHISNIYEQIMQYLQNIPQSTVNFSRDHNEWTVRSGIVEGNIANYSNQIQKNFSQMLKNPIKRLIKRIMEHAKNLYCKAIEKQTISTQTLMIKDQDNIKMLLKNNQNMKKQLQNLKKVKRESQKDTLKLLDSQQKNQIKISQLATQNTFLKERIQKYNKDLITVKLKLQTVQNSKKQLSQHFIRQHTTQRSGFLKSIRELQLKIEVTSNQLMRLRKQTQSSMISVSLQTEQCQTQQAAAQTQQIGIFSQDRSLLVVHSYRKNAISKFGHHLTKSINQNIISVEDGINQKESNIYQNFNQIEARDINKNRKFQKIRVQRNSSKTNNRNQTQQLQVNEKIIRNSQIKRKYTKRSIDKFNQPQQKQNFINENNRQQNIQLDSIKQLQLRGNSVRKNINKNSEYNLQLITSTRPILDLKPNVKTPNLLNFKSTERQMSARQSDLTYIQSKAKIQPSRMFLTKLHCTPYIGQQISNLNKQTGWLDAIEVNTLKRQNQFRQQSMKEAQNSQRMQFFSNLMQKYSKLKENGLLSKIIQIVSSNQFQQQQQKKNNVQNNKRNKQISQKNKKKIKKIKQDKQNNLQRIENQLNLKSKLLKQKIFFTKNQVVLLFGSFENAKKYQLNTDIWQKLQNSIMLDNNFMALCDQIQVFLKVLQRNQSKVYKQCVQFLNRPLLYLRSKLQKNQNEKQTKHKRNLTAAILSQLSSPNNHSLQKQQNNNQSVHQIRNIFHKILRFHKIIHKKCTHVEEFLMIIGFK